MQAATGAGPGKPGRGWSGEGGRWPAGGRGLYRAPGRPLVAAIRRREVGAAMLDPSSHSGPGFTMPLNPMYPRLGRAQRP